MSNILLTFDARRLRGTDSNSLLRLYDLANAILSRSPFEQERANADRAVSRIVRELQKRNVSL